MKFYMLVLLGVAAGTIAAPVLAAESVVALSSADKEALLEAAAERNAGAIDAPTINGIGRRIRGEVSMMVGTNGARGIAASMVAPIGETGTVALAFEKLRFGRFRRLRDRGPLAKRRA